MAYSRSQRRKLTGAVATGVGIASYVNARHVGHSRKRSAKYAGYKAGAVVGSGELVSSNQRFGTKVAGITAIHAGAGIAAHRALHPNQRNFKTKTIRVSKRNRQPVKKFNRVR